MSCGNGTERAQHPIELWGEEWMSFGLDAESATQPDTSTLPSGVDASCHDGGTAAPGK